jgi:hypothetical protein
MIKSFLDYLAEAQAVDEDQYGGGFGGGSVGPVTDTTSPIHGEDVEEDKKKKKRRDED